MPSNISLDDAPAGLGAVLRKQGFEALTAVQSAVLAPELAGRDLRISSQTGSGKTVALGLLLAPQVAEAGASRAATKPAARGKGPASPVALLIAPTRELAAQLGRELTWLFAPLKAKVVVVTGGTSVGREREDLRMHPEVVVGTPGRLLDHLRSNAIVLSNLKAVALDEADEMLAMNFEEELDGILEFAPKERTTHLVSATFPREVLRLADRMQKSPAMVQGTALGLANEDIEHVIMWVHPEDRYDAAVNLLLRYPDDKALLFVRTRADTVKLAQALNAAGLRARALSGEMNQNERTATFNLFREEGAKILVATDVAARGLDVQDIARVMQVDLPENSDVLTHRCGRTGRAGRQGTNVLFASPRAEPRLRGMLRAARITATEKPVPSRDSILEAMDDRLLESVPTDLSGLLGEHATRWQRLAERMLEDRDAKDVVAWLLLRSGTGASTAARDLRPVFVRGSAPGRDSGRDSGPRGREPARRPEPRGAAPRAFAARDAEPREERPRAASMRDRNPVEREPSEFTPRDKRGSAEGFITYQISWGEAGGADPSRILAMVCRRGEITKADVGAIRVQLKSSSIEIASELAARFEEAVARPDDRPPNAKFRRWEPIAKGTKRPAFAGGAPGKRKPPPKHKTRARRD